MYRSCLQLRESGVMKSLVTIAALLVSAQIAKPAQAEQNGGARTPAPSAFMRVHGASPAPFGFVHFCERVPTECVATSGNAPRFDATPQRLSELDEVNRAVNKAIAPATDLDLYGVAEHWTLPTDRGDCEDYALLKRQILMQRGWPSSAMLMTVVRDERGDGHAVLTARTAQGDFILDNKQSDIRLWHQTGYRYVMCQSFIEPRLWMSLAPEGSDRSGPLTSTPAKR